MSWFSNKNKEIYSNAWNAICEDTKTIAMTTIAATRKLATTGYNRIAEGITHLDKSYNTGTTDNIVNDNIVNTNHNQNDNQTGDQTDNQNDNQNDININSSDSFSFIDNSSDLNNIIDHSKNDINPNVIIELSAKMYIKRIYIIDEMGDKIRIKGKIASYSYIDGIVHKWFNYEEINGIWKWYPNNNMITSFRDSTPKLVKMSTVIFKNINNVYSPYPY